jgi:hypothetical protein
MYIAVIRKHLCDEYMIQNVIPSGYINICSTGEARNVAVVLDF